MDFQERRRQENIESIIRKAVDFLPPTVSDEEVSSDWISLFLNTIKDTNDEQIQTLWSRILSREVASPGSFSRRTIDAIRLIEKDEAEMFTALCRLAWRGPFGYYIFSSISSNPNLNSQRNKHYFKETLQKTRLKMSHLGLVKSGSHVCWSDIIDNANNSIRYHDCEQLISLPLEHTDNCGNESIHVFEFTRVGSELYSVANAEPDLDHMNSCLAVLKDAGWVA